MFDSDEPVTLSDDWLQQYLEVAHQQHNQQNQHLSQQPANHALQMETTPDSTTPNSQAFATSDPPSTPAEPIPSITIPSNTIEQPPIASLNPGLMLPPPAPNPSHVRKPDQTSSSPIRCSNCSHCVPTCWGYDEGAGYQIVTWLCALVAMIHIACAF